MSYQTASGSEGKSLIRVRPRGFCAGVVRAVDIVELALQAYGPPVYVHHEIVHNRYVVDQLAREVDLILVVGSPNSSNSNRLVEVAKRSGVPAQLIDDAKDIDSKWLEGIRRVGLTAGASAPEILVEHVSEHLASLGFTNQRDLDLIREDVRFTLPPELTTIAPASK